MGTAGAARWEADSKPTRYRKGPLAENNAAIAGGALIGTSPACAQLGTFSRPLQSAGEPATLRDQELRLRSPRPMAIFAATALLRPGGESQRYQRRVLTAQRSSDAGRSHAEEVFSDRVLTQLGPRDRVSQRVWPIDSGSSPQYQQQQGLAADDRRSQQASGARNAPCTNAGRQLRRLVEWGKLRGNAVHAAGHSAAD